MGQASLAVLNKIGISMHWQDAWDSQFSYTKVFNLKRFFLKFFKFFFEDAFFINQLMLKNNNNFLLCIENNFNYTAVANKPKKFRVTMRFFKKIFLGKIWILNKKNYFIISVYVYVPLLKLNSKITLKNKKLNDWLLLAQNFETSSYIIQKFFNKSFFYTNQRLLSI